MVHLLVGADRTGGGGNDVIQIGSMTGGLGPETATNVFRKTGMRKHGTDTGIKRRKFPFNLAIVLRGIRRRKIKLDGISSGLDRLLERSILSGVVSLNQTREGTEFMIQLAKKAHQRVDLFVFVMKEMGPTKIGLIIKDEEPVGTTAIARVLDGADVDVEDFSRSRG